MEYEILFGVTHLQSTKIKFSCSNMKTLFLEASIPCLGSTQLQQTKTKYSSSNFKAFSENFFSLEKDLNKYKKNEMYEISDMI